ncbi:MAG: winged helix-turn-helix transcriptional regulator [Candidatus Micrarchaeota archaeon]|nr:winged helix-turn-helix transcriptional regulator [Candidatus Micrarchaeota archaeon]
MNHKEEVYLYILESYRKGKVTQQGVAEALGISLSTVNNSLKPLRKMQAIEIKPRELLVKDSEKILTYWATIRKLEKETIYSTHVRLPIKEIEGSMPANVVFTAFSGYKFLFNDVPADYSEVYAYADEKTLVEIKKRFPEKKGPKNLSVLQNNHVVKEMSKTGVAPPSLLFVDLWNVKGWYARDFLNALGEKL